MSDTANFSTPRLSKPPGRPRVQLDMALVKRLADAGNGVELIAKYFAEVLHQCVSPSTVWRRLKGQ